MTTELRGEDHAGDSTSTHRGAVRTLKAPGPRRISYGESRNEERRGQGPGRGAPTSGGLAEEGQQSALHVTREAGERVTSPQREHLMEGGDNHVTRW